MKNDNKALFAAAALVAAVFLYNPPGGPGPDSSSGDPDPATLSDIFNLVVDKHVSRPDRSKLPTPEAMDTEALQKMLSSLDPHSSYLPPDRFDDLQERLKGKKFAGLGIEVMLDEPSGFIKIIAPLDGGPAQKSGIEAGDLLTHIDGQPVKGQSLQESVDLMRGEEGADITVTVKRGNEGPRNYTLTRELITVVPVKSKIIDGDIGYLRINTFDQLTYKTLRKEIEKIKSRMNGAARGYVIDLRNNPGGLLNQAIEVADLFMDEGRIVSVGSGARNDRKYIAEWGDEIRGLPIIVLTNQGSASASEIVAGALQDHERAVILGTQSYGKGSVQTIFPLGNGGALKLTTSLYFTPSGDSIQGRGITPDIRYVSPDGNDTRSGYRESALPGTIQNPETGQDSHKTTATCAPADHVDIETVDTNALLLNGKPDFQLLCAVDTLHKNSKYTITEPVPVPELLPKG